MRNNYQVGEEVRITLKDGRQVVGTVTDLSRGTIGIYDPDLVKQTGHTRAYFFPKDIQKSELVASNGSISPDWKYRTRY